MSADAKDRILRRALADPAVIARYHARVAPEPTEDGCRLWDGPLTGRGLPSLHVGARHAVQPKRIAWFLARGTVASHGKLLATCGNERCVESAHLVWRTSRRAAAG